MSWIFGIKKQLQPGVHQTGGGQPADKNDEKSKAELERSEWAYPFDSTALERAATAARTLENSSNAKQALELARLQEVTRQKEHDLSTKQVEARIAAMQPENARAVEEERRKTLGEETRHLKNLADYQDQLARKRAAEELAAKQEEHRKTVAEQIETTGSILDAGSPDFLTDRTKMVATVGGLTALAVGWYSAKRGTSLAPKYIEAHLRKPSWDRENFRLSYYVEMLKHPIRSVKQVFKRNEDPLKRVVLNLRLKTKSRVKRTMKEGDYLLKVIEGNKLIIRSLNDINQSRDMEELIKSQLNDKQPSEVIELQLGYCDEKAIVGLTDEFANLVILALNGNALSTLKGLPKLESLMSIDLSDNKLSASLDVLVERCPQLTHVNLSRNDIKEIEKLFASQKSCESGVPRCHGLPFGKNCWLSEESV